MVVLTLVAAPGSAGRPKPGGSIFLLKGTPSDDWRVFLDDAGIAERSGVRAVLHSPEKHAGNPLLPTRDTVPWESKGVSDIGVSYDPTNGWFHLYYSAQTGIAGQADGTVKRPAYARSRDGIHWERPTLGLVDFPGVGTRNNLVPDDRLSRTRIKLDPQPPAPRSSAPDPDPPSPDRRFVMLTEKDLPTGGWSDYAAVSSDGFKWNLIDTPLGDLRKTAQTTPPTSAARYVWVRQNWVRDSKLGRRLRGVYRMESDDMVHWKGAAWVFPFHAADYNPDWEDYGMSYYSLLPSYRYRGLLINFYSVFHTDPAGKTLAQGIRFSGRTDMWLAVSRDTIHWKRVGWPQPFLPLGNSGSWDAGMVNLGCGNVIEYGDKLLFYYEGFDGPHQAYKTNRAGLGLATLRRDGFVSLDAETGGGWVITTPVIVDGKHLELNADAAAGVVRVAILDEAGKPIPGFAKSDCRPLSGRGVEQRVRWKQGGSLEKIRGRKVSLRFDLDAGAKLYAYRVSR